MPEMTLVVGGTTLLLPKSASPRGEAHAYGLYCRKRALSQDARSRPLVGARRGRMHSDRRSEGRLCATDATAGLATKRLDVGLVTRGLAKRIQARCS